MSLKGTNNFFGTLLLLFIGITQTDISFIHHAFEIFNDGVKFLSCTTSWSIWNKYCLPVVALQLWGSWTPSIKEFHKVYIYIYIYIYIYLTIDIFLVNQVDLNRHKLVVSIHEYYNAWFSLYWEVASIFHEKITIPMKRCLGIGKCIYIYRIKQYYNIHALWLPICVHENQLDSQKWLNCD